MFQKITGPWGALGFMLSLIALYLILVWATNAQKLIDSAGRTGNTIFRTLQGR